MMGHLENTWVYVANINIKVLNLHLPFMQQLS